MWNRGVLRTLTTIQNGAFRENYFRKKLHLECLTGQNTALFIPMVSVQFLTAASRNIPRQVFIDNIPFSKVLPVDLCYV